ncbi:MAG: phosphopantothenate--cysteine ligase [Bacilli bacterium]|nr:phosphopantothenate--cysteine ligase [Bacilli bacterium]
MKKIVITAGGTSEKIDNVRKITNSSSGKLGMTIANHLLKENDDLIIYYVCSKNSLRPLDKRIKVIEIDDTISLKNKIENLLLNKKIDYFIHSMAVSDYMTDYVTTIERIKASIKNTSNLEEAFSNIEIINGNKISSYEDNLVIVLKQTPKIISIIKDLSPQTYLVGFKLLDGVSKEELISVAKKLRDKNKCDLVVANDLATIRNGEHIAYIIDKNNEIEESHGKDDIAKKLVRRMKNGK